MKIVIAGGSGYLGRLVAKHFLSHGWEVVTLARKPFSLFPGERLSVWDGKSHGPWAQELFDAEILLNLAGRSVNCRYHPRNRKEILHSRVDATLALGKALEAIPASRRPKLWMNSSTATIYRHALDFPQDETTGEIGKGFSVSVAKAWEEAFFGFQHLGPRFVALRTAMVFAAPPGGVYEAFRGIVRKGLGGRAGAGKQFVSWIHGDDFLQALEWIHGNPELSGVVNVSAPEPLPNSSFMAELRRSLNRPFGLPSAEWMLEIGAVFLRTETELLLKSRRVVPGKLLASGFSFRYPSIKKALADLARA